MHGNAGEIRTPFRLEQEEQFGALGLTLNAIVHWNAIYMQASLDRLRIDGWDIDPSDVSRLSPVSWRHINFLGRYDFSVPEPVLQGQLRPLAQPSSEWDL
jgi:hypothetical protein